MGFLTIWSFVNTLLICAILFIVFVLARQIGVLLNHIGPVGARQSSQGPRLGENIAIQTSNIIGLEVTKPTILIFGSSSCAICSQIKEAALNLHQYWNKKSSFVFVYDDDISGFPVERPKDITIIKNDDLRLALDVKMLPFAIMLDQTGKVVARGLVNDMSNLESLLEAAS